MEKVGVGLPRRLGVELAAYARDIDHHALVRAVADLFGFVTRRHREEHAAAVDLGDFRFRRHLMSDRRRREMADIDGGADRAFARFEIRLDGVERGVLHRRDHHRRGEHRRQHRILELVGEVRRRDLQAVGALGADRDRPHGSLIMF